MRIRIKIKKCKDCNKMIGSYTKTGRCRSCATKFIWTKKIDRSLNLKHGFYSIYKATFNYCIDCGKKLYNKDAKRCHSCENKRRFKIRLMNNKGIKNGQFIHGLDKREYPKEFNKELKYKIFKRNNFTCQKCNAYPCNDLTVHHIDYNKNNCNEINLITLCRKCNSFANHNRDYWFAYFTYINKELYND